MVISAKQGQIVEISKTSENPVFDVVPVAPTRGMITAGEGASTLSGDQGCDS